MAIKLLWTIKILLRVRSRNNGMHCIFCYIPLIWHFLGFMTINDADIAYHIMSNIHCCMTGTRQPVSPKTQGRSWHKNDFRVTVPTYCHRLSQWIKNGVWHDGVMALKWILHYRPLMRGIYGSLVVSPSQKSSNYICFAVNRNKLLHK